jgi:hypothetical protein
VVVDTENIKMSLLWRSLFIRVVLPAPEGAEITKTIIDLIIRII